MLYCGPAIPPDKKVAFLLSTGVRAENAPAEIADKVATLNMVNLRSDSETID
jgi:hypothetical protein